MDLNTMFAAMIKKFAEVQEAFKATNDKVAEVQETSKFEETRKLFAEMEAKLQESSRDEKIHEMSEVINNRVDGIDKKVADLETNIDKKVSDIESKLNNLQCQERAHVDNEEKAIELIYALKGNASVVFESVPVSSRNNYDDIRTHYNASTVENIKKKL
ncbi:hypothetical protein CVS40_9889 [Lucilia cuprina]|nr:hypothetical protein CVS40_9889 [Lucilia cuprina]